MQVECRNCQRQFYVDDEEGQFEPEEARCRNCGMIGMLKCLHATIATDVCVSCGHEFTELSEDDEESDDAIKYAG